MALLKYLLLAVICIASVRSDFNWGRCPNVQYELSSFDMTRYLGRWYEIARAANVPFQKGECTQAEYSLNDDGSIRVHNTELIGTERSGAVGKATPTSNPFRLEVTFGDSFFAKLFPGDYRVMNTDYEQFSIVYSCTDLLVGRFEFVWILSRTPQLPQEQVEAIKNFVSERLGYPAEKLRFTNQTSEFCGY